MNIRTGQCANGYPCGLHATCENEKDNKKGLPYKCSCSPGSKGDPPLTPCYKSKQSDTKTWRLLSKAALFISNFLKILSYFNSRAQNLKSPPKSKENAKNQILR